MSDVDYLIVPSDKPCVEVDLKGDGLLWMLNTTVLHPRGFAIGLDQFGRYFLYEDGSEPIQYSTDPEMQAMLKQRFAAFSNLLDRARSNNHQEP